MAKKNIHVVPNTNAGTWEVKKAGTSKPVSVHRTQAAADQKAGTLARQDGVERITHNRRGQIRSKDSFGPDHNPPKDKEH